MKKNLAFLIILFLSSAAKAQFNANKEPYLTRSLTKEAIQNVYARTSGGSIQVTGLSTGETRLEIYVTPNGNNVAISKEEIKKRMDEDYDLTVSISDNKLSVIAKPRDRNMNWKRQLSISYKIFVQQNVSTDLATSGGSINLSDLNGNQGFATSGGSLHLERLSGNIKGRTSGGSIDVSDCSNNIDLRTSGGSIKAEDCSGRIKLATSGGSLRLSDLDGTIEAKTSGGSIHGDNIKGELVTHTSGGSVNLKDMSCSLEASTSGGSVNVEITRLGKYVRLSNSGGNINLQIPDKQGIDLKLYANKITVSALNNFSGRKEDDEISGSLNGGGIPVNVRAGSGRITLAFR